MGAERAFQVFRGLKSLSFATVDAQGHPQARIVDCMHTDDDGLYFCTARGKNFYHELVGSGGKVAVVGLTPEYKMMRLTGTAHVLDNPHRWIDLFFDENPSLQDVYPEKSRYILEPFIIDSGTIEIFNLSSHPITRVTAPFGGAAVPARGFNITDACKVCGACAEVCPQGAITVGEDKAVIDQFHCLHCGLCVEKCPHDAIERLSAL